MKRACENCEWWVETAHLPGWGFCHGLPPYLTEGTWQQAQTPANQFCSLFRASEAKIREAG